MNIIYINYNIFLIFKKIKNNILKIFNRYYKNKKKTKKKRLNLLNIF